jgi:glycosyltransferase involved in cell wall biosynthesis
MAMLEARGLWPAEARVLGHVPQTELKNLMSRSHVMVLPSVQDGFGMVMAQAMACACPVIASRNTGSEDLFSDGSEGFIVPIRDVDALAERLQQLADQPQERAIMGQRALKRVRRMGGWQDFGQKAMTIYEEILRS